MASLPLLVSFPEEASTIDLLAKELGWTQSQATQARRLYRRRLPPLVDPKCLPFLFGVSPRLIAAMSHRPRPTYYRTFSIPKRGGGERVIEAPRRFLKIVQAWIHHHILVGQRVAPEAYGFVAGRSIFHHGEVHCAGKNLLAADVQNFFPSIQLEQVADIYTDIGFPPPVALQLARLSCLDDRLPQGAPTSPALANLAFRPVDRALVELARRWKCKYTRYADDLAFSGARRFRPRDIAAIERILRTHGFAVNDRKSRIIGQGSRQILTGLVINRKVHPPRWKRRLWRAMFHRASKHPQEFSERGSQLLGVAAFINQYNTALAESYRGIAESVISRSES